MPGISDSRINAGGKMSFAGSKAVANPTAVGADVAVQTTAVSAQILDLQGRVTVLEAKLVAASNDTAALKHVVDDLVARLTAAEATIASGQ